MKTSCLRPGSTGIPSFSSTKGIMAAVAMTKRRKEAVSGGMSPAINRPAMKVPPQRNVVAVRSKAVGAVRMGRVGAVARFGEAMVPGETGVLDDRDDQRVSGSSMIVHCLSIFVLRPFAGLLFRVSGQNQPVGLKNRLVCSFFVWYRETLCE